MPSARSSQPPRNIHDEITPSAAVTAKKKIDEKNADTLYFVARDPDSLERQRRHRAVAKAGVDLARKVEQPSASYPCRPSAPRSTASSRNSSARRRVSSRFRR
jgi:hypothetical protein